MRASRERAAATTKQQGGPATTAASAVTVLISGDVDQVHTHHHEVGDLPWLHATEAANDNPDSLDDEQHEALMREQRRREEFKRITGGIDEWRPRRQQLQRLITQFELDPIEVGLLYKHGYLSFKGQQLQLDRSRAPVWGAALLFGPGNLPAALCGWIYMVSPSHQVSLLAFLMFAAWFSFTTYASARVMRRWFTARRIARRLDAGPVQVEPTQP